MLVSRCGPNIGWPEHGNAMRFGIHLVFRLLDHIHYWHSHRYVLLAQPSFRGTGFNASKSAGTTPH